MLSKDVATSLTTVDATVTPCLEINWLNERISINPNVNFRSVLHNRVTDFSNS